MCVYVGVCVCVCVCARASKRVCTYMFLNVYMSACVCMCDTDYFVRVNTIILEELGN